MDLTLLIFLFLSLHVISQCLIIVPNVYWLFDLYVSLFNSYSYCEYIVTFTILLIT